jgi:hypothetical protein
MENYFLIQLGNDNVKKVVLNSEPNGEDFLQNSICKG